MDTDDIVHGAAVQRERPGARLDPEKRHLPLPVTNETCMH